MAGKVEKRINWPQHGNAQPTYDYMIVSQKKRGGYGLRHTEVVYRDRQALHVLRRCAISHNKCCHRGCHAKILGWAKSAAHGRRPTSDLWPMSHNIGIGDKHLTNASSSTALTHARSSLHTRLFHLSN